MKLTAKTPFSWAHKGVHVVAYAEGEEIDTEDADLIAVATAEGWAAAEGAEKAPAKGKAHKNAPENKAEGSPAAE